MNYFDYVLGAVPASLLFVSGTLTAVGVEPTIAVPVGGALSAVIIGHALFASDVSSGHPDLGEGMQQG